MDELTPNIPDKSVIIISKYNTPHLLSKLLSPFPEI